jgi:tRNA uridine 5-carbamoylmethylation protein Kti12
MKTFLKLKAVFFAGVVACSFVAGNYNITIGAEYQQIENIASENVDSAKSNSLLTPVFVLALARERVSSAVSLLAQAWNDVPNPYCITDIYLCTKATSHDVLSIIDRSNNSFKEQIKKEIAAYNTANKINNDDEIFWGIDTCNTIEELCKVAVRKIPMVSIRPVKEIMKTPGTFYGRNFKAGALAKLDATDILTTFSRDIAQDLMGNVSKIIDLAKVVKTAVEKKEVSPILQEALKYGLEQKDILVSCTRIASYLKNSGVIDSKANIGAVYPEMMISLAGTADVLKDSAVSEIVLAEVASTCSCC